MLIQAHVEINPNVHIPNISKNLSVKLAQTYTEIEEAQRLRHAVFSEEYGAIFSGQTSGIDEDKYDRWCDHLIVRDHATNRVVGTYRVLRPEQAVRAGGYYSESEFNLTGLSPIRDQIVEFGRACIDSEYRSGPALMMLWSGLSEIIRSKNYQHVLGCASVSLRDDGVTASEVWRSVRETLAFDQEWRITPHYPYPVEHVNPELPANIPPLIEGYLKLGVKVCGDPAWDPDFNTADFPMLLHVNQMNARYKKRLGFIDVLSQVQVQKVPDPLRWQPALPALGIVRHE